eukprot:4701356-Lingulodinium_polyedra.AAC.1
MPRGELGCSAVDPVLPAASRGILGLDFNDGHASAALLQAPAVDVFDGLKYTGRRDRAAAQLLGQGAATEE